VDSDDVCPLYDFVDSSAILECYGVSDVGELAIFEEEEVVVLG
jgi:hypothetical protein